MSEARYGFFGAVVGAICTLAAALVGSYFGFWKDSRDIDLRMIDVALAILSGEKGAEPGAQHGEARRFAIEALKLHSGVKMEEKHWVNWIENPSPSETNLDRLIIPDQSQTLPEGTRFSASDDNITQMLGEWVLTSASASTSCTINFTLNSASKGGFYSLQMLDCDPESYPDIRSWDIKVFDLSLAFLMMPQMKWPACTAQAGLIP